ncbi:TPA: hypothetical protein ACJG67_003373 [Salmonella enterica subsp. enterica serovar Kottbus]
MGCGLAVAVPPAPENAGERGHMGCVVSLTGPLSADAAAGVTAAVPAAPRAGGDRPVR